MNQPGKWFVYARSDEEGRYTYRTVDAEDFAGAQEEYSKVGMYTFVYAEPKNKSPFANDHVIISNQIEDRLRVLGVIPPTNTNSTPSIPIGPRKRIPVIVAEVHNATPVDAKRAWDAVVAACKGT